MDYSALIGIAVGLAMDAFAVSLTNGAMTRDLKFAHALKIAFCFGLFQMLMPVIGWLVGIAGADIINQIDHWIAFVLLGYIGGKMIYETFHKTDKSEPCQSREPISFKMLIVMSVATSIDALATGIILPSAIGASTGTLMLAAVSIIGLITFVICLFGVYIGKKFGDLFSRKAEFLGGIVLIFIGTKILLEHLFFS